MQNKDEDDVKGKEKGGASIIGESRGEKIHTKNGTFQQLPFDERFVYHHLRADLCDFLDRDSVNTVLAVARSWKTRLYHTLIAKGWSRRIESDILSDAKSNLLYTDAINSCWQKISNRFHVTGDERVNNLDKATPDSN